MDENLLHINVSCCCIFFFKAVISLSSIKSIRLEKVLSGKSQGMLMYIDTKPAPSSTYCFGLWLEAAELIAERIRVVTQNAKRTEVRILQDDFYFL